MEELEPGSLRCKAELATKAALTSGALQPIATALTYIEAAGLVFPVRQVLDIKPRVTDKRSAPLRQPVAGQKTHPGSPFLNPEPQLRVAEISSTHVCLLNKFPVFDDHLLIATRQFEDQDASLNLNDFVALWTCLIGFPGLGFYNGGTVAGASQQHKHLQLVPLPLAPRGDAIPMAPLLDCDSAAGVLGKCPSLPFAHVMSHLPGEFDACADPISISRAAETTWELYRQMLDHAGIDPDVEPLGAYNLLITRQWILLVRRYRERFESISVNALGFAGHFLVRDASEFQLLRAAGPLRALQYVASDNASERC
jgi:ATP adenylyltransferase